MGDDKSLTNLNYISLYSPNHTLWLILLIRVFMNYNIQDHAITYMHIMRWLLHINQLFLILTNVTVPLI